MRGFADMKGTRRFLFAVACVALAAGCGPTSTGSVGSSPAQPTSAAAAPTGTPGSTPTVAPTATAEPTSTDPESTPGDTAEPSPSASPSTQPPEGTLNGWPATWATDSYLSAQTGPDDVIHVMFPGQDGSVDIAQVDSTGHQARLSAALPAEPVCRPLATTGRYPCTDGSYYFTADGLRFNLDPTDTSQFSRVEVVDPSGSRVAISADRWESLAIGADSTLVVWRRTIRTSGGDPVIAQTTISALNSSARPLPGWPRTFAGAVSMPTVGDDGTVYVVVQSGRRLVALSKSGAVLAGWPYTMPAGLAPRLDGLGRPGDPNYPVAPTLGRQGVVYVPAVDGAKRDVLLSLDHRARLRPGWPAILPGNVTKLMTGVCTDWCGPYYEKPLLGGSPNAPVLYISLGRKLLAIDDTGKLVAGWPKAAQVTDTTDPTEGWTWWSLMLDGSLAAMEVGKQGDHYQYRLWRWHSDGSVFTS